MLEVFTANLKSFTRLDNTAKRIKDDQRLSFKSITHNTYVLVFFSNYNEVFIYICKLRIMVTYDVSRVITVYRNSSF